MKVSDQTLQQVERTISKVADKFPANHEASILTDIHLRANQETGELVAFDDDDNALSSSNGSKIPTRLSTTTSQQ